MEIEAACRQVEQEVDATRARLGVPTDGSTANDAAGAAADEGQPGSGEGAAGPAQAGEGEQAQPMEQRGEPAAEADQGELAGQTAEAASGAAGGEGLTEQQQEEAGRAAAAADGPVPAADDAMQE